MSVPTVIRDGFVNLVSMLGTWKDARTATTYQYVPLSFDQLNNAYRSNWLARRIVDAVADDATREWRSWQASEEQIQAIEDVEKDLDFQRRIKAAIIKARLYGGGAIIMGVDQGEIQEPLDLDTVGKDDLKFIVPLSCWELTAGRRITDVTSPWYGRPEYYTVSSVQTQLTVDYADRIHPSRVIEFVGNEIPDWNMIAGSQTWGDSVINAVDDVIKDFGMTISAIASMVNDAKVDVIKIPNLTKSLSDPEYEQRLLKRLTASNVAKSTVNSLLMDVEEEWERTQTNFSGLPPLMAEFIKLVAGASGIPMTRLVGHGPGSGSKNGGSGSGAGGGETDMRNYYDDVMSKQKTEYSPALAPLDEVLKRSALGTDDPKIYYEWTPLYQPDPSEQAAIALQKAQVAQADVTMGLINPDVLREVRINQLVEDSFYPGLQDAVDELGAEPEEPEVTPEDVTGHLQMLQQSSKQLQQIGQQAQPMLPKPKAKATDAKPRKRKAKEPTLDGKKALAWLR